MSMISHFRPCATASARIAGANKACCLVATTNACRPRPPAQQQQLSTGGGRQQRRLALGRCAAGKELEFIRESGSSDGTVTFHFGTDKEVAAFKKSEKAAETEPTPTKSPNKKAPTSATPKTKGKGKGRAAAPATTTPAPKAKKATEPPTPSIDISSMKVVELKELAKSKGLTGYSKLKKKELIDLLSQ